MQPGPGVGTGGSASGCQGCPPPYPSWRLQTRVEALARQPVPAGAHTPGAGSCGWAGRPEPQHLGEPGCTVPAVPALRRAEAEPHRGRAQGAGEGRGGGGSGLGARGAPGGWCVRGERWEGPAEPALHPAGRQAHPPLPDPEGVRGEGARGPTAGPWGARVGRTGAPAGATRGEGPRSPGGPHSPLTPTAQVPRNPLKPLSSWGEWVGPRAEQSGLGRPARWPPVATVASDCTGRPGHTRQSHSAPAPK